jgi:spore coat protein CotH
VDLIGDDPSYFPVTVQADDHTWCSVGMRWKGNATLSQSWNAGIGKLPFRLDFEHYEDEMPEVDNQRFYGFRELGFGNGQGDATLIRDVMASEILEDAGLPAAHNAFYRVTLDFGQGPVYMGLYTVVEDPSDAMMDRVFGDDSGNLYKPEGDCANFTCFAEDSFEKKSNAKAGDYSDVMAVQAALYADRSDEAAWRAGLEATFDVDGFLHWLAVNAAIENWDANVAMAHNYYLYGDPAQDGRMTWIPWDHNLSLMDGFQGSSDPLLADVSADWPLIRFLLDDPIYSATYKEYLASSMKGAYDLDTFTARAHALSDLVSPELFGDDGEIDGYTTLTTAADYATAVDELITHAQTRQATVTASLK